MMSDDFEISLFHVTISLRVTLFAFRFTFYVFQVAKVQRSYRCLLNSSLLHRQIFVSQQNKSLKKNSGEDQCSHDWLFQKEGARIQKQRGHGRWRARFQLLWELEKIKTFDQNRRQITRCIKIVLQFATKCSNLNLNFITIFGFAINF